MHLHHAASMTNVPDTDVFAAVRQTARTTDVFDRAVVADDTTQTAPVPPEGESRA